MRNLAVLAGGFSFRGSKIAEIKSLRELCKLRIIGRDMPMWYYRFTFEQATVGQFAIFEIEIERSAFNRCDWNGPAFLAAARPLMLDDRKRINSHLGIYWHFSNLSMFIVIANSSRKYKSLLSLLSLLNLFFKYWHSCLRYFFSVWNYLKNT